MFGAEGRPHTQLAQLRVRAAGYLHLLADLTAGEVSLAGAEDAPRPAAGGAAEAPDAGERGAHPRGEGGPPEEERAEAQVIREEARPAGTGLAQPGPVSAQEREPAACAPLASASVTGGEHAYAVWLAPDATKDLVGVHAGGARAWRGISARLAGRAYNYRRGDRLRRYADLTSAVAAYEAEAARHGAAPTPRRFYW